MLNVLFFCNIEQKVQTTNFGPKPGQGCSLFVLCTLYYRHSTLR